MCLIRLFILNFLIVFNSFSQIEEPVIWNSNINKISDENYLITIEAYIEKNWRLYSQNLPKGAAEPTEFIFEDKPGNLNHFRQVYLNQFFSSNLDARYFLLAFPDFQKNTSSLLEHH